MYPPIYAVCSADTGVTALLGSPPRLYPFGEAPQGVATPYAVWRVVTGSPENYLAGRPDIDGWTIQVDVYDAGSGTNVINVAKAIRDAVELKARIGRWGGQDRDPDTGSYHVSFDVDWMTPR